MVSFGVLAVTIVNLRSSYDVAAILLFQIPCGLAKSVGPITGGHSGEASRLERFEKASVMLNELLQTQNQTICSSLLAMSEALSAWRRTFDVRWRRRSACEMKSAKSHIRECDRPMKLRNFSPTASKDDTTSLLHSAQEVSLGFGLSSSPDTSASMRPRISVTV